MMTNFLFCLKLESGGFFIGWLSLVTNLLCVVAFSVLAILLGTFKCDELRNWVGSMSGSDLVFRSFDGESCFIPRTVTVVLIVICALFALGFTIISYLCIKGVHQKNHLLVRPLVITTGITAVISLLGVLSFTLEGIISSLLNSFINCYFFIVLYSLYRVFKKEFLSSAPEQYHPNTIE